jgi:cobalt-precorrin-6B (C15)-methyltransferase
MNDNFYSPGIPDEDFIREEGVPMTKNEIRVLSLSKLRLFPGAVVYDIGAGSGSVAIECKLINPEGRVFAIENNAPAITLIKKNSRKFGVKLEVIEGTAPSALNNLPPADRIFLGGSSGKLEGILDMCDRKLKTGGRLVVNAVTLHNAPRAYAFLKEKNYTLEAVQVNIALIKEMGTSELWQARNPVTIIAAQKKGGKED